MDDYNGNYIETLTPIKKQVMVPGVAILSRTFWQTT
jgi:hypothetical protein